MNPIYVDTARMLVAVAPLVLADDTLALKGGTAINLFLRNMPRLSVDLDLTFTNYRPARDEALAAINHLIREADGRLRKRGFQTHIVTSADVGETKLFVRRDKLEVKVEVNFVLRGTVHPIRRASLTPKAKQILLADLEVPILSPEDIYGGKLVAAMDRQHPRDLFDVLQLFANEGITPGIRRSFVIYLASHNRPMHEVLFPAERDISQEYERTFQGMTTDPIELSELLSTRARLIHDLPRLLTTKEQRFLISLANAEPDWSLLDTEHVQQLPAIKWKVQNLQQLAQKNAAKLREQASELTRLLDGTP